MSCRNRNTCEVQGASGEKREIYRLSIQLLRWNLMKWR